MVSTAQLVRDARTSAGLTQAELAQRMETTQSVIARLESPGANPRLSTLERAIAAAGRTLEVGLGPSFGLDETLIASNLRLDPAERLRRFASAYAAVRRLRAARPSPSGS
jgi:transcriptional regulator with XRE-family HTH domain